MTVVLAVGVMMSATYALFFAQCWFQVQHVRHVLLQTHPRQPFLQPILEEDVQHVQHVVRRFRVVATYCRGLRYRVKWPPFLEIGFLHLLTQQHACVFPMLHALYDWSRHVDGDVS